MLYPEMVILEPGIPFLVFVRFLFRFVAAYSAAAVKRHMCTVSLLLVSRRRMYFPSASLHICVCVC